MKFSDGTVSTIRIVHAQWEEMRAAPIQPHLSKDG